MEKLLQSRYLKRFTISIVISLLTSSYSWSQFNVTWNQPAEIIVANDVVLIEVEVENTSESTFNGTTSIELPAGIVFVDNSLSSNNVDFNTSNSLSNINVSNFNPGETAILQFQVTANCDAIQNQLSGTVFRNKLITPSGNYNSTPYNILYAALTVMSVDPKNTSVSSGEDFVRQLTVINGGNGSIGAVDIIHKNSTSEFTIIGSSLGSVNNDVISLQGADFASFGNGDNYLNQNETFTIDILQRGVTCSDKTISSKFEAAWYSETNKCQSSTTNINTTIDFADPNLTLSTQESFNTCGDATSSNNQSITINNTGQGTADNIIFDIFNSSGGDFDNSINSRIDISSINITRDGQNVDFSVITSDAIPSNESNACLGSNPIGAVQLSVPSLPPSASYDVQFNTFNCCNDNCNNAKIGGWKTAISYYDVCGLKERSSSKQGQETKSASANIFVESEPTLSANQNGSFNYIIDDYTNTYEIGPNSKFELSFTLGPGISYLGAASINWRNSPTIYAPESVTFNNNTITAIYDANTISTIKKTEIELEVIGNCTSNESQSQITFDFSFIPDGTCNTGCPVKLTCDFNDAFILECPNENCITGGARNIGATVHRHSLGRPDNNDDGIPENSGNLDLNKIKLRRIMSNDTLKVSLQALVHSNWQFGGFNHTIETTFGFNALYADVTVYDNSSGVYRTAVTTTIQETTSGNSTTFNGNISPSELNGQFTGYTFDDGDSIKIDLYLIHNDNIGGDIIEVLNESYIFLSENSNLSNEKKCNTFYNNITIIGYFLQIVSNENYTVRTCSQTIKQDYKFSVGSCCSNFAGGNLFPYEYRNWGYITAAKLEIPQHYTVEKIVLKQFNTLGKNNSRTYTINNLTIDGQVGQTLDFDLSQYAGNSLPLSDEGYSGRILVTLAPNCDIPLNQWQAINWYYNFATERLPEPSETGFLQHTKVDNIRYSPSLITLNSTNPVEDGVLKQVSWNTSVQNPLSENLNYGWIDLISVQNNLIIESITDDVTGNPLPPLSGGGYNLPTLSSKETRNLTINARYTDCSPQNLVVESGYSCHNDFTSIAEFKCPSASLELQVEPKPAQLQVQIDGNTVGDICSPLVDVELLFTSVRLGAVDSLQVLVTAASTISNNSGFNSITYPLSESYSPTISPTRESHTYMFPVYSLDADLETNGLPGITNINQNQAKLKMQFEMDENFQPGDHLTFSVDSKSSCNAELPQINLAFDPSIEFDEHTVTGLTTQDNDSWSISWGDYDNDGDDDAFITNYDESLPNQLFRNNGNLDFTEITNTVITQDLASSLSASWGDYNNDGYIDLFVANNLGSPNFLYSNNGNGTFTKQDLGHITTHDGYSHGCTWGDYNNDGYLDLLVSDFMPTRYNLLYMNNGGTGFTHITDSDINLHAGNSIGASWMDIDGDNDLDLFVPNAGQQNHLYINEGGTFNLDLTRGISSGTEYSTGASWGDVDNDGDADLLVINASQTKNNLYINDGNGYFTIDDAAMPNLNNESHGSSFGDLDNDGDLDLVITNDQNQMNNYYMNDGTGSFNIIANALGLTEHNSFANALTDIDLDGDLDIFIANHSNESNQVILNAKGSCNNSLCLKMIGQNSNTTAIGTKVIAYANIYGEATSMTRYVQGQTGGGAGSQNSLNLHFGMGNSTTADSIRIFWPSGMIETRYNISTTDCNTIYEPTGAIISGVAYHDINSNCIKDANETILSNQVISVNGFKVRTDANGEYSISVGIGSYDIQGENKGTLAPGCSNQIVTITSSSQNEQNINIGYTSSCNDVDLEVVAGNAAFRRGFADDIFITVSNTSVQSASFITLKVTRPAGLLTSSSTPNWDYEDGDTLFYEIDQLDAQESYSIVLRDSVTLDLAIGDNIQHLFSATQSSQECDLTNNTFYLDQEIVGAIDPNDKAVTFSDGSSRAYGLLDENFNYKIRFENIGTYYASRVIIIDTLDHKLDPSTISTLVASHDYQLTVEDNIMTWVFEDIKLPTTDEDPELSQGFVSFTIQPYENEGALFSTINNTAHIQFDFEDYIATNTVSTEMLPELPGKQTNNLQLEAYPSVATSELTLELYNRSNTTPSDESKFLKGELNNIIEMSAVTITDVYGRIVHSQKINGAFQYTINVETLSKGSYFVEVSSQNKESAIAKFIKQ